MKRILPLLLALCPLVSAAVPPMDPPPSQVLAEVKTATRCKIEYANYRFTTVEIELPQKKEAEVLALLAQMEPVDDEPDWEVDIDWDDEVIFETLIITTPEGKKQRIDMLDIGYSGSEEPLYDWDFFKLPRPQLDRLEELVSPEDNLDIIHRTIAEQERKYMAKKAAELEIITHAAAVRLEYRYPREKRVENVPLTPVAQREILSILSQLQLSPAEKTVQYEHQHDGLYRYLILTCGDKTVELMMDDIGFAEVIAAEKHWQNDPFCLPMTGLERLDQLARKPKARRK